MDLHSFIHPEALDLVLGSATNAANKGQSKWSTPVEVAAALAEFLPKYRPVLVDLTGGPGQLLAGAANKSTETLLGLDLDPRAPKAESRMQKAGTGILPIIPIRPIFIQGDLTALYEPMRAIDFRSDCFVINPPWSLNWHCARLEGLADSVVPAVAKTFKALCPSTPSTRIIDSTLATLLITLDRLSTNGEGLLIG